ncbi:MAG: hypothetical protein PHP42_03000, partial [Bacteroidota bacterium]|nr:hypothetical protein [Bacteroidota bacterium]
KQMKYPLPEDVIAEGNIWCKKKKSDSKLLPCLNGETTCCSVERIISPRFSFVHTHCSTYCGFSIGFGNKKCCGCPVRVALWEKYNV